MSSYSHSRIETKVLVEIVKRNLEFFKRMMENRLFYHSPQTRIYEYVSIPVMDLSGRHRTKIHQVLPFEKRIFSGLILVVSAFVAPMLNVFFICFDRKR